MAFGWTPKLLFLMICSSTFLQLVHTAGFWSFWGSRKVDCGVSIWSNFVDNPDGSRTRSRVILRYPQNGGAKCPILNETETINPWTVKSPQENAKRLDQTFIRAQSTQQGIVKRQTSTIFPRDILFIIDSSGSVRKPDFDMANENIGKLIAKICGSVGLGSHHNRVAAITFSNQFSGFDFDDYDNLAAVQNAIQKLTYYRSSTHTAEALNYAENMFKSSAGMRVQSVKEVVVLSDGLSNGPGNPILAAADLSKALSPNIAIYSFFIGGRSEKGEMELQGMVSSPVQDHLFVFRNYQDFNQAVTFISNFPDECAPIVIA